LIKTGAHSKKIERARERTSIIQPVACPVVEILQIETRKNKFKSKQYIPPN
jgi:hypothetical protein